MIANSPVKMVWFVYLQLQVTSRVSFLENSAKNIYRYRRFLTSEVGALSLSLSLSLSLYSLLGFFLVVLCLVASEWFWISAIRIGVFCYKKKRKRKKQRRFMDSLIDCWFQALCRRNCRFSYPSLSVSCYRLN